MNTQDNMTHIHKQNNWNNLKKKKRKQSLWYVICLKRYKPNKFSHMLLPQIYLCTISRITILSGSYINFHKISRPFYDEKYWVLM